MQEFEVPKNLQLNSSGVDGLYEDKVHLTKESRALNDTVVIEIMEQDSFRHQYGDIILPDKDDFNSHLVKGKIISVGPKVNEVLVPGDVVLYDKLSAFYNPPTRAGVLIVTKVENVICIILEDK